VLASALPALVLLELCVLSVLPGRGDLVPLILLALGAGLLGGALTETGAVAGADVAKAYFAAGAGMALALYVDQVAVLAGVAAFVAAVDVWSVLAGPSESLARSDSGASDFLSIYLPALGGGRAGVIGVVDLLFLALFAAATWQLGLRRRATALALLAAPPIVLVIEVLADRALPVLPALALAVLAVNADLIPRRVRSD
jgi:hypothetical protein